MKQFSIRNRHGLFYAFDRHGNGDYFWATQVNTHVCRWDSEKDLKKATPIWSWCDIEIVSAPCPRWEDPCEDKDFEYCRGRRPNKPKFEIRSEAYCPELILDMDQEVLLDILKTLEELRDRE